jgi:hypothetical protein
VTAPKIALAPSPMMIRSMTITPVLLIVPEPADRARNGRVACGRAAAGISVPWVLVTTRRATHYESVPMRCSRVQIPRELYVRRLLLVAIVGY